MLASQEMNCRSWIVLAAISAQPAKLFMFIVNV